MKITIKRIITCILIAFLCVGLAVGVNADYVDMLDHGLYFSASTSISTGFNIYDSGGAGAYEKTVKSWIPMWALDSYETGTTYTMKFSCTVPQGVNLSFSDFYVLRYHAKQEFIKSSNKLDGAYGFASYDSSTGTVDFTVKFNTDISNLGGFPIYVYLCCPIDSQVYNRMITNSWSTSVEYDPGGSKFLEEYLDRIINAGSGYPLPDSAASSLDSGVSSINSAEGELTGKSSSLMDSVSEDWTANKNTAKTFLTTIQPTAVQVKNFYTTLTTALPDEVKALFAIIPLLLFIGYLLGRVK